MDPKEIKRLQEIARLHRQLKELKRLMETVSEFKNRNERLKDLLREHKDMIRAMPPGEREVLREAAAYDEEEWQKILEQLMAE